MDTEKFYKSLEEALDSADPEKARVPGEIFEEGLSKANPLKRAAALANPYTAKFRKVLAKYL